ncbi:hypothetical protein F2Q65_15430 [Thiohalocapsa marina]|uniref:Uncharacterized protein n=1 Tax=Thiohalocapsa marina TaxID=424902 RepID=A0A5M8FK67_9GAMM|nr:hypothetical protein [Thiohalocapsa marina]KAA6183581.1 hypothetical protein F2Q65_15430 [Thiohalocapsa marina]
MSTTMHSGRPEPSCRHSTGRVPPPPDRLPALLRVLLPGLLPGLLLALLLPLLTAPSAAQADDGSPRATMADAMARMMEAMGFLDDAGDRVAAMSGLGAGAMPGMAQGMMPGLGQMGQTPFGFNPWMPGAIPNTIAGASDALPSAMKPAAGTAMQDMMEQLPGAGSMLDSMSQMMPQLPQGAGWQHTTLDGLWEGRLGGLLIVQAHRFRLYAPHGGFVDGLIQQRGERVVLYDPSTDIARPYDMAQHQGRLVLRDPQGQVFLYRRLWLEELDRAVAPSSGQPPASAR